LQVGEDALLRARHVLGLLASALLAQGLGRGGLVVLQRLHGEGASHAQALVVSLGLVVESDFFGFFVVGDVP